VVEESAGGTVSDAGREGAYATLLPGVAVSPRSLFVCGALLFPPFLLQQDIVIRAGLILAFMLLNALGGRRVRVLQAGIVAAAIVIFNLVIPTGRVLAAPWGIPITESALKSGLMKATTMTGLVFLSQFSIRSSLRLPGRIGGLIGRCLFYFEAIMSERGKIDRRNIIGSLDAILMSIGAPESVPAERLAPVSWDARGAAHEGRGRARGLASLGIIAAAVWASLAATVVFPHPFWGS
jgi:hypothetical protein